MSEQPPQEAALSEPDCRRPSQTLIDGAAHLIPDIVNSMRNEPGHYPPQGERAVSAGNLVRQLVQQRVSWPAAVWAVYDLTRAGKFVVQRGEVRYADPRSQFSMTILQSAPALWEEWGLADTPAATASPRTRRRRGRPADTDAEADRRIAEAWETGRYRTRQELAEALRKSEYKVKCALDRHRQRQGRRRAP